MSPGSIPGNSSDSPEKTYCSPFGAPLATSTSINFLDFTTLFPLQLLHRSLSLIISPSPLQTSQGPVDWEYIPGPSCIILVLIPLPLHASHCLTPPSFAEPFPLQASQILSLVICILAVFPLYTSSSFTLRGFSTDFPFLTLGPPPPPPRPPMPKRSKISPKPLGVGSPCNPSSPNLS